MLMFLQDLRHGVRMLVKSPGFALIATLSIAIGVGANATIFSAVDAILTRPLPVPRPHEVVTVSATTPDDAAHNQGMSYPDYVDLRDGARSFEGLVAYRGVLTGLSTRGDEPAQRTFGMAVSGNLFGAMEVQPALGRFFLPDEDRVAGRDPVLVLDHAAWAQSGSDPSIVGRRLRLGNVDFTVVGVAPAAFSGVDAYDHPAFYVPLAMLPAIQSSPADDLTRRDLRTLRVKGRLKPDVTLTQARLNVQQIATDLARSYPDTNRGVGLTVRTELDARRAANADLLWLPMVAMLTLAVLLVGCANVTGLLASRAPVRMKEMALRLAIGAGRLRLIRQLVTESLLIASAGAILGLALGYVGILAFQQIEPNSDIPLKITYELNGRVVMFGLGIAVLSAVASSLIPAWQITRLDLIGTIKNATAPPRSRQWGRQALVCGQVALSLLLVTVAATVYRAFSVEMGQGPGFRTERILMMTFDPQLARYDDARTRDFYRLLKDRAMALPGVVSVALTTSVPMGNPNASAIVPEGVVLPAGRDGLLVRSAAVDEGYFDTMDIAIIAGRGVEAGDSDTAPRVAVVNDTFAARYWPNQTAVGKRLRLKEQEGWIEIVGVAETTKYSGVSEAPTPFLYVPWMQHRRPQSTLLVHSDVESAAMAAPTRNLLGEIGPQVPVFNVRTMEDFYLAMSVRPHNLLLSFVAGLGLMGLTLALIGLYGIVAYAVSRRTREIGIRMAVGAAPGSVVRMVLRRGLWLTIAGIVAGTIGSAGIAGFLRAAFPSVQRVDGWTYLLVIPILFAVTLLAAYIPARRAARVDPLLALRAE